MAEQPSRRKVLGIFLALLFLMQTLFGFNMSRILADDNFFVTNLQTEVGAQRKVTLHWDAHPDATGYYIFRMYDGDSSMPYIAYTLEPEFLEIPSKGGFVYYVVIPFKKEGNGQIQGTYTQNTYGYTAPPATSNLRISQGTKGVHLAWNPSAGATEYVIKRRIKGEATEKEIARTRSIEFTDEESLQHGAGTTFIYNVYPVYKGRGIELQGLNENYVFVTLSEGQTPTPIEPDEPTKPDVPIPDNPTTDDPSQNDPEPPTSDELEEVKAALLVSINGHDFFDSREGDPDIDFITVEAIPGSDRVTVSFVIPMPLMVGVKHQPTLAMAYGGSQEIWRVNDLPKRGEYSFTVKRDQLKDTLNVFIQINAEVYNPTNQSVNQVVSNVIQEMDKLGLKGAERIEYAYAYVRYTTNYSHAGGRAGQAVGALVDRDANCWGFSAAFKAIMDQMGVPCFIAYDNQLSDDAGLKRFPMHAWNYVKYNGRWYSVDTVWGYTEHIVRTEDPALQMVQIDNIFPYLMHLYFHFMKTDQVNAQDLKVYPQLAEIAEEPLDYLTAFSW